MPNHQLFSTKSVQFELNLPNRFKALGALSDGDMDAENRKITATIMTAAVKSVGRDKLPKPDKLTAETHQQREK